jgi:hypothetical protein
MVHNAPQSVLVEFVGNSRRLGSCVKKFHGWLNHRGMAGEQAWCVMLSHYDLQQKGPHRQCSAKGECSSMEEGTPTSAKHGRQSRVRGTVPG